MGTYRMMLVAGLMCISLVACSTGWPQARLANYLAPTSSPSTATEIHKRGDVRAGLLVINDTSAHDSAPQLSAESFDAIKEHIQFQLAKEVTMALVGLCRQLRRRIVSGRIVKHQESGPDISALLYLRCG